MIFVLIHDFVINPTLRAVAEANYKMGKKDGKWFIRDDNGTLRYDMTDKNKEKTGVWYIYDESGKLVASNDFN